MSLKKDIFSLFNLFLIMSTFCVNQYYNSPFLKGETDLQRITTNGVNTTLEEQYLMKIPVYVI